MGINNYQDIYIYIYIYMYIYIYIYNHDYNYNECVVIVINNWLRYGHTLMDIPHGCALTDVNRIRRYGYYGSDHTIHTCIVMVITLHCY